MLPARDYRFSTPRRLAAACLLSLALSAPALAKDVPLPARLLALPDVRQHTVYACGAGALQAVLAYYGIDARQDTLMAALGTDEEIGTRWWEIVRVAGTYGVEAAPRWNMRLDQLEASLDEGVPVLLALQAWAREPPADPAGWRERTREGHYVIAIGYDAERIYFEDPAVFGVGWIGKDELPFRWHDFDEFGRRLDRFGLEFRRTAGPAPLTRRAVRIE